MELFQDINKQWITDKQFYDTLLQLEADQCDYLYIHTSLNFGTPNPALKRTELLEYLLLTIKKLGPIKNVEMDIRRVNVIIGPQSSGKSTVAKVISTCEWVEKEVATMMDEHIVPDANAFRDLLVKYHRMIGYFNSDTLIRYESDHVSIVYENEELHISLKSKDTYQREKICYVPAERNMITSPELQG